MDGCYGCKRKWMVVDFSFILTMFRLDNYGDIIKAIGIKSNEKYEYFGLVIEYR